MAKKQVTSNSVNGNSANLGFERSRLPTRQPTLQRQRLERLCLLSIIAPSFRASINIVKSQSGNGEYTVNKTDQEWVCDCPDNTYRHTTCKHIHAVIFSQRVRVEVAIQKIEPLGTLTACIYCGLQNFMKAGLRKNNQDTSKSINAETATNTSPTT